MTGSLSEKLERTALVLLAAGQGRRFGGNKLSALAEGRSVAFYAAETLERIPFLTRFVVSGPQTPDIRCFGFERIDLTPEFAPLSRSIALGIAAAGGTPAQAALIALADMPLVSVSHFLRLVSEFDGRAIASSFGGRRMPPAIFGRASFAQLMTLSGDRGASALLKEVPSVALDRWEAIDIDSHDDLNGVVEAIRSRSSGRS